MYYRQIFGQQLSKILDRRGITQRDLAAELGFASEASISRYVKGIRSPDLDMLVKIAKFLNVSINELLDVEDPRVERPAPDVTILLSCYSRATDADRTVLWALMDRYMTDDQRVVMQAMRSNEDGQAAV